MTTGKIVSFEKEKERIEFNKCEYYGSVTICIAGESLENAIYNYYLEYIEEDELLDALEILLKGLIPDVSKMKKIEEPKENILNRTIVIHYYLPTDDGNTFFYEHEPFDLTENQLKLILIFCISNLEQQ